MNNREFWKQIKSRHTNPTFSSKWVQSSLFVETSDKDRYIAKNNNQEILRNFSATESLDRHFKNEQSKDSLLMLPQLYSNQNFQTDYSPRQKFFQSSSKNYQSNQVIRPIKRQLSEMTSSSKQVFRKQEKPFDIIKGTMKSYKSQLNLFPKFRLERLDDEYKKRQAFVKGDIETIRKLNQQSKNKGLSLGKMIERRYDDFFPFSLKKKEPVQTAFKITQNPQIISKKLVLEK